MSKTVNDLDLSVWLQKAGLARNPFSISGPELPESISKEASSSWDKESLRRMLQARLEWASNNKIHSLHQLIVVDRSIDNVEELLVEAASGSPMRLIALANKLLSIEAARQSMSLDKAAWEEFLIAFNSYQMIQIDAQLTPSFLKESLSPLISDLSDLQRLIDDMGNKQYSAVIIHDIVQGGPE